MAKNKNTPDIRYAVNRKQQRKAEEAAARREQAETSRREEAARKNARMSRVFLFAVLAVAAVFFVYMTVQTLFFPAASVHELRTGLLLVSIAAVPYLIVAAAILLRRLMKHRRDARSERAQRLSTGFFLLVVLAAFGLCFGQLYFGRSDASGEPGYTAAVSALEQSGLPVVQPEEVSANRSLFEYSLESTLICGRTCVLLNYHHSPAGWVASRFAAQAVRDYAAVPQTAEALPQSVQVWGPADRGGVSSAAVVARDGNKICILELSGPAEELETLLPLLTASAAGMRES